MVQRYETLYTHTIRLSPNTYADKSSIKPKPLKEIIYVIHIVTIFFYYDLYKSTLVIYLTSQLLKIQCTINLKIR